MTKLGNGLVRRMEAMEAEHPGRQIPVVVTMSPGADTTDLEHAGLKIERLLESVSIVAGTVAVSKVEHLARLDQVEAIDYDGEIRAF